MKLFFCTLFTCILFTSCDLIGEIQENGKYEYIRKSQLYLGSLSLYTSKKKIDEYLGKPDSTYEGLLYYDRISIFVTSSDSLIWEINSTNPNYSTPDGITIGDSREEVIKAYGETESWITNDKETLSYRNYHLFQQTPLYLIFSLKNDTVQEIRIWWHYE